jgi:hypothetical protein
MTASFGSLMELGDAWLNHRSFSVSAAITWGLGFAVGMLVVVPLLLRPRGTDGGADSASWSKLASRHVGRLGRGGRLEIVGGQLAFTPHGIERSLGANVWLVPAQAIAEVVVTPRTWMLLAGGYRRRLQIELEDGSTETFFVNDVHHVAAGLRSALARVATPVHVV